MKEYEEDLFSVDEELKMYADNICLSAERLQMVYERTQRELWVFDFTKAEVMQELLYLIENTHKFCQYLKNPDFAKRGPFEDENDVNPYILPSKLLCRKVKNAWLKTMRFEPNFSNNLNNKQFKESIKPLFNYVIQNYGDEELKKRDVMSIAEDSDNAFQSLKSFTQKINDLCYCFIAEPFQEILDASDNAVWIDKAVANTFRVYSENYRKECLNLLKVQARRFKESHTGGLKEMEQMMYDQVLEGTFVNSKEKCFNVLDKDFRNKVQNCRALVEKLDRINVDGCLWLCDDDSEDGVDMTDIYEVLDTDNFLIFCKLALIHNLIQCEVYSDLKPEFEAWINDEEAIKEDDKSWTEELMQCIGQMKDNLDGNDSVDLVSGLKKEFDKIQKREKRDPLHSKKAMVYWGRLQDEGLIDDELKPLVSLPKAAMIASVMGEYLKLSPAWTPFEKLWGVSDLASQFCKAKDRKYYDSFLKNLINLLK